MCDSFTDTKFTCSTENNNFTDTKNICRNSPSGVCKLVGDVLACAKEKGCCIPDIKK